MRRHPGLCTRFTVVLPCPHHGRMDDAANKAHMLSVLGRTSNTSRSLLQPGWDGRRAVVAVGCMPDVENRAEWWISWPAGGRRDEMINQQVAETSLAVTQHSDTMQRRQDRRAGQAGRAGQGRAGYSVCESAAMLDWRGEVPCKLP